MDQHHHSNIREAFNAAAAQAVKAFPEVLRHLVVTTVDDVVFTSPEILSSGVTRADLDTVRTMFVKHWAVHKMIDASCGELCDWPFGDHGVAIGINADARDVVNSQLWWNFDHELGHLIVPNGNDADSLPMRECIAETYAALRHAQRHGVESEYIKDVNLGRANTIIGGYDAAVHYYHPLALDKVETLKTQTDLSMLSAQETVDLTTQIVTECFWSGDNVRSKIQSAANDLNEGYVTETRLVDLFSKANDVVVARFYQDVLAHRYPDTKPPTNSVPKRLMKDGF